ncbi:hypothetical protein [Dongia rigui]|uniref:Uncharacterized protein n=1 Tax=Dongia rigui TaxID=940149 RepID=A0ABU5E181_9PROT|nr:hypothetical protein [Dongia rigui]MDY0873102.1 hypothetical protein [Dongia rigui]
MTSPIDIMRCAKLLCDQYGAEADLIAAVRADRLLEQGELDGYATWKAILRAIVDIRSQTPRDGQSVH